MDKDRAREMRKSACNIWLAFEDEGSAPATWRQASTQVRKKYYESMSSQFPELKLCDMDWKAEQLASDNYSSWHSYRARIKLEKDSHHRSKRLRTDASELVSSISLLLLSLVNIPTHRTFLGLVFRSSPHWIWNEVSFLMLTKTLDFLRPACRCFSPPAQNRLLAVLSSLDRSLRVRFGFYRHSVTRKNI